MTDQISADSEIESASSISTSKKQRLLSIFVCKDAKTPNGVETGVRKTEVQGRSCLAQSIGKVKPQDSTQLRQN